MVTKKSLACNHFWKHYSKDSTSDAILTSNLIIIWTAFHIRCETGKRMHLQWLEVIAVSICMKVQGFSFRVNILFISHHL